MAKGGNILRNIARVERNDKKRDCTYAKCRAKLIDGVEIVVVRTPQGKPRAYFCGLDCQQSHEHEYLERSGFYDNL